MAKYGPDPYPEAEKRVIVPLSVSNKGYPRLKRLRDAIETKEGHPPSKEEVADIVKRLSYRAIDAYCEAVERDQEALIIM